MARSRIIVAFLVLAVLLDRGLGAFLNRLYQHASTGESGGQLRHALENRDFDVLIFGTSRARHHVDPKVIERELGLTGYNYGSNGRGIYYARIVERLLLAEGTSARTFLLQVEPFDLYDVRPERAMVCAPLADKDQVAYDLLARATPFGRFKLLSRTYRFNSMVFPLLFNVLSSSSDDALANGYMGLPGAMTDRDDPAPPDIGLKMYTDKGFDPLALPLYEDFISDAGRAGIRVVLFGGPWFRSSEPGPAEQRALDAFHALAARRGLTFLPLDERSTPAFRDRKLFREPGHLNAAGAQVLSSLLARELRSRGLVPAPRRPREQR